MNLVVASNNIHKIKEIKEILGPYFKKIFSLREAGIENIEIEETGKTFKENAHIKAETIKNILPDSFIISDDSGICVESLNFAPGIYSARYSKTGNDKENNKLLLKNLKDVKNRKAFYEACIAFYSPKTNKYYYSSGKVFGEILKKEKGFNGFGYDPLFYCYDLKKTFAEITQEEKNKISHRYNALINLLELLKINKEI